MAAAAAAAAVAATAGSSSSSASAAASAASSAQSVFLGGQSSSAPGRSRSQPRVHPQGHLEPQGQQGQQQQQQQQQQQDALGPSGHPYKVRLSPHMRGGGGGSGDGSFVGKVWGADAASPRGTPPFPAAHPFNAAHSLQDGGALSSSMCGGGEQPLPPHPHSHRPKGGGGHLLELGRPLLSLLQPHRHFSDASTDEAGVAEASPILDVAPHLSGLKTTVAGAPSFSSASTTPTSATSTPAVMVLTGERIYIPMGVDSARDANGGNADVPMGSARSSASTSAAVRRLGVGVGGGPLSPLSTGAAGSGVSANGGRDRCLSGAFVGGSLLGGEGGDAASSAAVSGGAGVGKVGRGGGAGPARQRAGSLPDDDGYDPLTRTPSSGLSLMSEATGSPVLAVPMMGGSLPIDMFESELRVPLIIVPTVNHDDNQHAKDENLRVQNLFDGIEVFAALMTRLGPAWNGVVP